jgi:hypothetical protein
MKVMQCNFVLQHKYSSFISATRTHCHVLSQYVQITNWGMDTGGMLKI